MDSQQREDLYGKALATWGGKAQLEMAQEEATELALAIRKHIRKNDTTTYMNVIDEIADVEIMIEQMELMHEYLDFRDQIEIRKDFKLNRLKDRLDNLNKTL